MVPRRIWLAVRPTSVAPPLSVLPPPVPVAACVAPPDPPLPVDAATVVAVPPPPAATASWKRPRPVSREAAIAQQGTVVIAGGLTTGDVTIGDAFRLDPATGIVTPLPPLSSPVHDCAGAVLGGRPAVLGGGAATE